MEVVVAVRTCYNQKMSKIAKFTGISKKDLAILIVAFLPIWLAFERPNYGFVAIFGLSAFFFWFYRQKNAKTAFFGGLFFGFLFMAWSIKWVLATKPEDWAGVPGPLAPVLLTYFVWIGSSFVLASGIAFSSICFFYLKRNDWLDALFLPALWVLWEYARNWMFVFWSWGDQSILVPNWSFGAIGYFFVNTPFLYLSRAIGLYGLSFLGAFLAVFFVFVIGELQGGALKSRKRRLLGQIAVLFVFLAAIYLISVSLKNQKLDYGEPRRFAVLRTNTFGPIFYTRSLDILLTEDKKSGRLKEPLDVVVFPEGSLFFAQSYDGLEKSILSKIFDDKDGVVITSTTRRVGNKNYIEVLYKNKEGEIISSQRKYFLMPGGEYMPSLLGWLLKLFGTYDIINNFMSLRSADRADFPEMPVAVNGYSLGSLACSGIISPELYRGLARDGANILINVASQGIFAGSQYFLNQMEIYDRYQAASLARPFVQSANGGLSYFIDESGGVVQRGAVFGNTMLYQDIKPVFTKTIFARFGHWPVLIFSFFTMAGVIGLRVKETKTRKR